MAISQSPSYQEIRGDTGPVYRVGEDPPELMGRSRSGDTNGAAEEGPQ
jgi:hypothetical protein